MENITKIELPLPVIEVVEQLQYSDSGFNPDLIKKVLQMEVELTPICLNALKYCLNGLDYKGDDIYRFDNYLFHIYSLYFLGIWKNRAIVPILFEFCKDEDIDWIVDTVWGSSYWEDLPLVLAECMTFEDVPLLIDLMHDNFFWYYPHYSIITNTFKYLIQMEKLSLDEFSKIVKEEIIPRIIDEDNLIDEKVNYANLIMDLKLDEYRLVCEEIAKLQEKESDIQHFSIENVRDAFSAKEIYWGFEDYSKRKVHNLLFDEMSQWKCFFEEELDDEESDDYWSEDIEDFEDDINWMKEYYHSSTIRRDEPKIGRNEPCPCGSGKKYKKCCL